MTTIDTHVEAPASYIIASLHKSETHRHVTGAAKIHPAFLTDVTHADNLDDLLKADPECNFEILKYNLGGNITKMFILAHPDSMDAIIATDEGLFNTELIVDGFKTDVALVVNAVIERK